MYVVDVRTGKKHKVVIGPVLSEDYKVLTKKEYFFNWKLEKQYEVFKITIEEIPKILGLVSIERIPEEYRIHIRLLTVSLTNQGKNKQYKRIVGNILTYVSKLAVIDFAELACVSLKPKSAIVQHYINTYGMNITGATLSLEILEIFALIEKFDNETNK